MDLQKCSFYLEITRPLIKMNLVTHGECFSSFFFAITQVSLPSQVTSKLTVFRASSQMQQNSCGFLLPIVPTQFCTCLYIYQQTVSIISFTKTHHRFPLSRKNPQYYFLIFPSPSLHLSYYIVLFICKNVFLIKY